MPRRVLFFLLPCASEAALNPLDGQHGKATRFFLFYYRIPRGDNPCASACDIACLRTGIAHLAARLRVVQVVAARSNL